MTGSPEKPTNPEDRAQRRSFPLPLLRTPQKSTIAWAIAGFDPSSGAGVTADLMTFAAHGVFGCSVITALTVQSTLRVFGWEPVNAELVRATLDRLHEDLPFAGAKVGMLGTGVVAGVVGAFLKRTRSSAPGMRGVVVLDPVLRSSSGRELFPESGLATLHEELLPFVDWITPNWAELTLLSGIAVNSLKAAEDGARALMKRHGQLHVVVTGGDQEQPTELLLCPDGRVEFFPGERVDTDSTHGTGCAFSSALLCELLAGEEPADAVRRAKAYVEQALRCAPGLGGGRGPMGLLWPLEPNVHTGALVWCCE